MDGHRTLSGILDFPVADKSEARMTVTLNFSFQGKEVGSERPHLPKITYPKYFSLISAQLEHSIKGSRTTIPMTKLKTRGRRDVPTKVQMDHSVGGQ